MIHKTNDLKIIIIQVVLTVCIAFIPLYFYLEASFENQKMQDKMMLKNYSSSVFFKMKQYENENNDIFYYPRSNIFLSGIFDKDKKPIFSLLENKMQFVFETEFTQNTQSLCYKQNLPSNIFEAQYIITCKKIDNSLVIYNTIILVLVIICLIFVSSYFTIKQSTEPYKKLNSYLDNFLKDAMHELKTPIGVARVNIDMLQMKIKDDKHLLRIKSALKNMSIIYEDLEYYMHRVSGIKEKKEIDFSLFLERRVEFFKDLATAKKIAFEVKIQNDIKMNFNEIELFRIIDNNLSNAIKYSKENSKITIILEQQKNIICFSVSDEGIGIKDTNKIFSRYYRGDKITGGFGIGLSIVKKICDKNSIKIEVDSIVKKGSSFRYFFTTTF